MTFTEKIQQALQVDYEALAAKVGPIPVPAIDGEGAAKIVQILIGTASQCFAGRGRGYPLYWLRSPHVTAGLPDKLARLIKLTVDLIADTLATLPPTHPGNMLYTPLETAVKAADPVFQIGFDRSAFTHPIYTLWKDLADQINEAYDLVAQKRGTPAVISDWRYGPMLEIHALFRGFNSEFADVVRAAIKLAESEKNLIDLAVRWKLVTTSSDHTYDDLTVDEVLEAQRAKIAAWWEYLGTLSRAEEWKERRKGRRPGEKQIEDALDAYHAARGHYDAALKEIRGAESRIYDPINSPEFVTLWQQYRTVIGYLQGRAISLDAAAKKETAKAERAAARQAKKAAKVQELGRVIEIENRHGRLHAYALKKELVGRPADSRLIVDAGQYEPVIILVKTLRQWLAAYLSKLPAGYDVIEIEIDHRARALKLSGTTSHAKYSATIKARFEKEDLPDGPEETDSFLIGLPVIGI